MARREDEVRDVLARRLRDGDLVAWWGDHRLFPAVINGLGPGDPNLDSGRATGYRSGPDLLLHDRRTFVVVVQSKYQDSRLDAGLLARQVYSHGVQLWAGLQGVETYRIGFGADKSTLHRVTDILPFTVGRATPVGLAVMGLAGGADDEEVDLRERIEHHAIDNPEHAQRPYRAKWAHDAHLQMLRAGGYSRFGPVWGVAESVTADIDELRFVPLEKKKPKKKR